jgi:hypothetical protein
MEEALHAVSPPGEPQERQVAQVPRDAAAG